MNPLIVVGLLITAFYFKKIVINKDQFYLIFLPIFWAIIVYNGNPGFGKSWPFYYYFTFFPAFPDFITNNVDKVIILSGYLYILVKEKNKFDRVTKKINLLIIVLLIIAIFNLVYNNITLKVGASSFVSLIKNFLLFLVVIYIPIKYKPLSIIKKFLSVFSGLVIISLIFSIIQKYILKGGLDDNFGFLGSNSVTSYFASSVAIYFLFLYFFEKKLKYLIIFFIGFIATTITSTDRVELSVIIIVPILWLITSELNLLRKIIYTFSFLFLLIIVSITLITKIDPMFYLRLGSYYNNIEGIGLAQAYIQLPEVIKSISNNIFWGIGAGKFGNPATFYSSIFDFNGSNTFYQFIVKNPVDFINHSNIGYALGAIDTINAVPIYILIENGIIFFILFTILNLIVLLEIKSLIKLFPEHKSSLKALFAVILFLLLSLFINFIGTYESLLYFQPWFILLGLYKKLERNKRVLVTR